jgi:hypothetical protein
LKQDQVEVVPLFHNTHTEHRKKSIILVYSLPACTGGCFGGLVDTVTKMALVNGRKPSFEAIPSGSISNCLQYIIKKE